MDGSNATAYGRAGLLDRARIVARPGFNRWMVPPAALAIHLCIGMSYGLSVFWLPLARAIGVSKPVACAADSSLLSMLTVTDCDWRVPDLLWTFTIGIVFLGASAAIWGGWLERAGPRRAGVVAALCWAGGFVVSSVGVHVHQLWLIWLGTGVIGGVGLGLGYISPVSTLIKWFPDRRGMATGMAIMGFGGGALVGAPLATNLMAHFKSDTDVGVASTFLVMAAIYFVFMMGGAFGYRVPPEGWQPPGWSPPPGRRLIAGGHVHLSQATRTPQFWLLWAVLLLNVSAGISVLGIASPMLQEIFGGSLIGQPATALAAIAPDQKARVAAVAAGFVGLLSLFNIAGRFFWASLSDRIGRKTTYATFFLLGLVLYAVTPTAAETGNKALFVACFCVILSMYGGGFASIPAYLADVFGTQFVGAIHGRLLTAWSTAGVVGLLVTQLQTYEKARGVPSAQVYDVMFYVLAGILAVGFVANLLVRPVASRWFMSERDLALVAKAPVAGVAGAGGIGKGGLTPAAALAWAVVVIPIAWGIYLTLLKVPALFG